LGGSLKPFWSGLKTKEFNNTSCGHSKMVSSL
jgi:hypothetical protein